MEKIKIMVVEDDSEWMQKIKDVLLKESNFIIAETITEQDEAIKKCILSNADIVLMDIALGANPYGGIFAIKTILREKKQKFIMLTCFNDNNTIIECYQSGAMDYVLKSELEKLPATILSVHSSRLSHYIIQQEFKSLKQEQKKLLLLNKEEKAAFDLREKGFSINQIAMELQKSPRTIKNQFRIMFRKFNVENYEELCKYLYK